MALSLSCSGAYRAGVRYAPACMRESSRKTIVAQRRASLRAGTNYEPAQDHLKLSFGHVGSDARPQGKRRTTEAGSPLSTS
jgi:hypothetical protein